MLKSHKSKAMKSLGVLIDHFNDDAGRGGQKILSQKLKITPTAVNLWLKNQWLPLSQVKKLCDICKAEGLNLAPEDFRPDLKALIDKSNEMKRNSEKG